jgi:hypothetical protein
MRLETPAQVRRTTFFEMLDASVRREMQRRLHKATTSDAKIRYDQSVPFPLDWLDPHLR